MYLYPYKIFGLSQSKRLLKDGKPYGSISDYDKYNYKDALQAKEDVKNSYISVLLGKVRPGIYLNVLDLDGCINEDKQIKPKCKKLLENFSKEEWEFSCSGTGIHIYTLSRKKYNTFHYKNYFGEGLHQDLEFYTDKRHIVTTTFDFENVDLVIGKYDKLLDEIYNELQEKNKSSLTEDIKLVFNAKEIKDEEQFAMSYFTGRKPVEDMFTLRGCGYKDDNLIAIIDANPETVDQSQHDAKLLKKLMYYTLSFESAYNMAKKTNYYKAKDDKHKKKFDNPSYIERTRQFIERM